MNIEKFTDKVREVLADAQIMAVENKNPSVEILHLHLALLNQDNIATNILKRLDCDIKEIRENLKQCIKRLPQIDNLENVYASSELVNSLSKSNNLAEKKMEINIQV